MSPDRLEDGALQDLRLAGGVLGDAIRTLWRDEFAPTGEWRTFCEYPLIEADRLYGVLADLVDVVCEVRSMVRTTEGAWLYETEFRG